MADERTAPERAVSPSRTAAVVEARRRAYALMHSESAALRDDPDDAEEIRAARDAMGAAGAW